MSHDQHDAFEKLIHRFGNLMFENDKEHLFSMGCDKPTYWESMIKDEVTRLLNTAKKSNVYLLDVGCGAGKWDVLSCEILSNEGDLTNFIMGFDISKEAIMKAQKGKLGKVKTYYALVDASHIPVPDETFNIAFEIAILHHLSNYKVLQEVLKEIRRVTENNSIILFVENTIDNPFKNSLVKLWKSQKSTHLHLECFTSSLLLESLNNSGFRLVELKYENLVLVYVCTVLGFIGITLPKGLISFLNKIEKYLINMGFWRYCATVHLIVKTFK